MITLQNSPMGTDSPTDSPTLTLIREKKKTYIVQAKDLARHGQVSQNLAKRFPNLSLEPNTRMG